jgi:hypothetical protein
MTLAVKLIGEKGEALPLGFCAGPSGSLGRGFYFLRRSRRDASGTTAGPCICSIASFGLCLLGGE